MKPIVVQVFSKSFALRVFTLFAIKIFAAESGSLDLVKGAKSDNHAGYLQDGSIDNINKLYDEVLIKIGIDKNEAPILAYKDIWVKEEGSGYRARYVSDKESVGSGSVTGFIFYNALLLKDYIHESKQHIVVSNKNRSDEQICAVLAHELGHFLHRKNEISIIEKENEIARRLYSWHSKVPLALSLSTVFFTYKYDIKNNVFFCAALASPFIIATGMAHKSYSFFRKRELECDRLAAQHYPEGLIDFFNKSVEDERNDFFNNVTTTLGFSTHPTAVQRIAAVQSYLNEQK